MASSPPGAHHVHLPNTKKRPSISSQASLSGPAAKRPKLHPLRQTSFPVNADGSVNQYGDRPRSEKDSGSVVNSAFSARSSKRQPKSRGRPKKVDIDDHDTEVRDGQSTFSKRAGVGAAKSTFSTRSGAAADDAPSEDDEDVPDIEDDLRDEAAQREEAARLNRFVSLLSDEQNRKWTVYRAAKLRKKEVRRIVNQTVSQSVGATVVEAVQFFSKAFAIEIIERAREVQVECAKAYEITRKKEKEARLKTLREREVEYERRTSEVQAQDDRMSEVEKRKMSQEITKLKESAEQYIPNKHAGGLLPDHLREALRRYKSDGEGGGFGFDGLSHPLLGVHGSNAWRTGDGVVGVRLFQ